MALRLDDNFLFIVYHFQRYVYLYRAARALFHLLF